MQIDLIQVPYEVEQRETAMARAPGELLAAGFAERLAALGHAVGQRAIQAREATGKIAVVASVTRRTARLVARSRTRKRFPLVLSGGCLTAVGVATGLQRPGRRLAVVWIDAHGDFNTPETTPSGYWDGMALAAICGRSLARILRRVDTSAVSYDRVAHLGGRKLDPLEIEDFARLKMLLVPAEEVAGAAARVRERIGSAQELYLHIDLDGLDPSDAPAVNFPEPGGIALEDLLRLLAELPAPAALTLAGMNFESTDDAGRRLMLETCLRLARAAVRG